MHLVHPLYDLMDVKIEDVMLTDAGKPDIEKLDPSFIDPKRKNTTVSVNFSGFPVSTEMTAQ